MKKEIYTTYAPNSDMTFIMCDTYEGEDIKSTEVVGWYHGEPHELNTMLFTGKTKATF